MLLFSIYGLVIFGKLKQIYQMRKFKFVGDPLQYDLTPFFWKRVEIYNVFEADFKLEHWGATVGELAEELPNDWQEITDEIQMAKPLHKDTDLGYFAGEAMRGLMSLPDYASIDIARESIAVAKELIKRLDNETGN